MKILPHSFYNRPTLLVAQELLGKVLVRGKFQGMITETEAYLGFDDPASHAAKGETPRSKIMFGPAGFSYVYLIYGMYHCLNVVTEKSGFPAAVLIRGIQLLGNTQNGNTKVHLDGPGKLCRHLGITRKDNGMDMSNSKKLYVACIDHSLEFIQTPRIGIKVGQDKLWRFVVKSLEY